jgi:hypothetical protein
LVSWPVYGVVAIGTFTLLKHFGYLPTGSLRRFWLLMAGAAACLPIFVIEAFLPPIVDATAIGDKITYEFKSPVYAFAFASLNRSRVE